MTPQEAIKILRYTPVIIDPCVKTTTLEYNKMLNVAEEALEKQIPKKPTEYKEFEDGAFYNIDFMCSACNNAVIGQPYKPSYCKHCGQALDWSDTE